MRESGRSSSGSDAPATARVDGVVAPRQAGSTLKPFLYARAIEKGWTAATLLPDVPIVFGAADENEGMVTRGVLKASAKITKLGNRPAAIAKL